MATGQVRRLATIRHGSVSGSVYYKLRQRVPPPYTVLVGEVGFLTKSKLYTADIAIADITHCDDHRVLPKPPKMLIEIMSLYNYTPDGWFELQNKLTQALQEGTETVWLIHTGVKGDEQVGVQVFTSDDLPFNPDATPLLKSDEELKDAGLNLGITAQSVLE